MLVKKLISGCKWISCIDVHPSGDHLIVGSYDRRVAWFDLDLSSTPYKTLKYHTKVTCTPRGRSRYRPRQVLSQCFFCCCRCPLRDLPVVDTYSSISSCSFSVRYTVWQHTRKTLVSSTTHTRWRHLSSGSSGSSGSSSINKGKTGAMLRGMTQSSLFSQNMAASLHHKNRKTHQSMMDTTPVLLALSKRLSPRPHPVPSPLLRLA